MDVRGIYKGLCPNCGGDWAFERAAEGLLCERCGRVCERPKGLRDYCSFREKVEAFKEFFKKATGYAPYALQLAWAKRFLLGRSFGIIAPTGIGKSTLGLALALRAERALILVPTVLLAQQSEERLKEMAERAGMEKSIKAIHGRSKDREPNADIIITTTAYFGRHYKEFPSPTYIFVDDVDAFLKASKNVERVLYLLGYSEKEIERAYALLKRQLRGEKVEWRFKKPRGILVFSSATAKPRGIKPLLLYYLLGFAVGKSSTTLRNVEDFYRDWDEEAFFETIGRLRDGILVFVSSAYGREKAEEIAERLRERGIEALPYTKVDVKALEAFREGKVKALVGIASYKNPLARGIDVPERAKYALFYGVPRLTFTLKGELPLGGVRALLAAIYRLRREPRALALLSRLKRAPQKALEEAREYLKEALTEELIEEINRAEDVAVTFTKEGIQITVGDVAGYLQASGRVSRMYAGGIAKGLALLFVDDRKAFKSLAKRLRWFKEGEPFKPYSEEAFWKVVEEIEKERAGMKKAELGKVDVILSIVESPNKVKTIAKLFSDAPVRRRIGEMFFAEFSIGSHVILLSASIGHLFDLTTKDGWHGILWGKEPVPVYTTIKRCDGKQVTDEIECEGEDKITVVESLREAAWEVDRALLATDPDTEGEKIAFDLYAQLRPFLESIERGEMHAITRREFLGALEKPRQVDENLVKAQQVRRIADRIVGFELSQRAQAFFKNKGYSVGRVQTPVLGWVIERWQESREREKAYFVVIGKHRVRMEGQPTGEVGVEFREETVKPLPPFTTDALLREANRVLKLSAKETMEIAQSLFEKGFITYHRTDYLYVSPEGRRVAEEYLKARGLPFVPRAWGEEGAHEAIRPTRPFPKEELVELAHNGVIEPLSPKELALYDLIFRRFMASQMKEAKVVKALIKAGEAKAEVYVKPVEEGFLLLWPSIHFVPIEEGVRIEEGLVPKAYPYTQGELVEEMKRKGIGRPSTYATIVDLLLKRGYVVERKGRLIPTKKGIALYHFAKERFGFFVSESFTRELEELMDKVEEGKVAYGEALAYIKEKLEEALGERLP